MHYSRPGVALRDGKPIAAVTVTDNSRESTIPVPIAGFNRIDEQPETLDLPSTIVFDKTYDDGFARELNALADAVDDVGLKRKQRDADASRIPFTLRLDDDGCERRAWVTWPKSAGPELSWLVFPLTTVDL